MSSVEATKFTCLDFISILNQSDPMRRWLMISAVAFAVIGSLAAIFAGLAFGGFLLPMVAATPLFITASATGLGSLAAGIAAFFVKKVGMPAGKLTKHDPDSLGKDFSENEEVVPSPIDCESDTEFKSPAETKRPADPEPFDFTDCTKERVIAYAKRLETEEERCQFLRSLIENKQVKFALEIAHFPIQSREKRTAMARFFFEKLPRISLKRWIIDNLNNFFNYSEERYAFLKLCVEEKRLGVAISRKLPSFQITNLEHRYELLCLIVEKGAGRKIPFYIEEMNLSEEQRYQIALKLAARGESNVCVGIENFAITDPEKRYEILKAFEEGKPKKLIDLAKLFSFTSALHVKEQIELLTLAIREGENFMAPELQKLLQCIKKAVPSNDRTMQSALCLFDREAFLDNVSQAWPQKFPLPKETKSEGRKWERATLQALLLVDAAHREIKLEALSEQEKPFIKDLIHLRDLTYALKFEKKVIEVLEGRAIFPENWRKRLNKRSRLPLLLMSPCIRGFSEKEINKIFKNLNFKESSNRFFDDSRNLNPLLRALYTIEQAIEIKETEKQQLIKKIFHFENGKIALHRAQAVEQLIVLGEFDKLSKIKSAEELDAVLAVLFQEQLGLQEVKDFALKYSKTFAQFRDRSALMRYASTLKKLPEEEHIPLIKHVKDFALHVMEGVFKQERYRAVRSSHLELLWERVPAVMQNWATGGRVSQPLESKGYTIEDSDDPCDLLLIGTETPSCQGVDEDPSLSKCLLAYLLDGKNRAIVIKNRKGKIVLRAVIRLLWNEKNQSPILFREDVYRAAGHFQSLDRFLLGACEERAKALGIPLLASLEERSQAPRYRGKVVSLGSVAPFEYVDSEDGEEDELSGKFSIKRSHILFFSSLNS